jgi:hypothetical protein
MAEREYESQQTQQIKSPRKLSDTTYFATQEADLPMETDMEEGLTLIDLAFTEDEYTEDDIRGDIRRGYSLALRFVRKYAEENTELKQRIKQIIVDAANDANMDYLMKEHDQLAEILLPLAKNKGFGRQSQPVYPWEYKFAMQQQLKMTSGLQKIIEKKK